MQQLQLPFLNNSKNLATSNTECRTVPLPPRRREVLALYLAGQRRKQIARLLGVSPHTIRNHIRLVYEDFGFTNRIEALRWAMEQPDLAQQIMQLSAPGSEEKGNTTTGISTRVPSGLDQAIGEAIKFFQNEVINDSTEGTS